MLYYMDSKVFEKIFLVNVDDQDILDTQYVLVSNRIRTNGSFDNIILQQSLYPSVDVYSSYTKEDMRDKYIEQLKENDLFFAAVIEYDILHPDEKTVFLCSKRESKIKYLKYMSMHVWMAFKYPIYNYEKLYNKEIKEMKFSEEEKGELLKRCEDIIGKQKKKSKNLKLIEIYQRFLTISKYKDSNKGDTAPFVPVDKDQIKLVKKYLKKEGMYNKNMNKEEIVDTFLLIFKG